MKPPAPVKPEVRKGEWRIGKRHLVEILARFEVSAGEAQRLCKWLKYALISAQRFASASELRDLEHHYRDEKRSIAAWKANQTRRNRRKTHFRNTRPAR